MDETRYGREAEEILDLFKSSQDKEGSRNEVDNQGVRQRKVEPGISFLQV